MTSPTSEQIKKKIEGRFDAFLADLKHLVSIDSDTGNMAGSRVIADWLKKRIEAAGGTYEEVVSHERGGVHVIARFKGKGKKKGVIIVHTDTVHNTKGGKFPYRYDPATKLAYGPGVGDCKASALMALHLVEAFHEFGDLPFAELIVYFDAEEEGGGSTIEHGLSIDLAKECDYVFLADTGRPNLGIVTKRKTNGTYTFTVTGVDGHAGNAPHAGSNALLEACHLAVRVAALASPLPPDPWNYTTEALEKKGVKDTGQYIPDNAINVAVLQCENTKSNVIPPHAVLTVNLRCYEQAEHERIVGEMKKIAAAPSVAGCTVVMDGKQSAKPMELTPEAKKLVELYAGIAKRECGTDVALWTAGGVTMANQTAQFAPTIDAVGLDVDPMIEHSEREFMDTTVFMPRTIIMYHFVRELLG